MADYFWQRMAEAWFQIQDQASAEKTANDTLTYALDSFNVNVGYSINPLDDPSIEDYDDE